MTKNKSRRNRRNRQRAGKNPPPQPNPAPPAPPQVEDKVQAAATSSAAGNLDQSEVDQIEQTVTRHVRMDTVFTAVIAVAAVIQGCVSYFQWDAMDRGLDLTDQTLALMQKEQRAWLSVGTPVVTIERKEESIELTAKLRNLGKSQAFVRFHNIEAFFGKPELNVTEDQVLVRQWHSKAFPHWEQALAPGDEMDMGAHMLGLAKPKDVADMDTDKVWLYIVGWVDYDDPLEQNMRLPFCFVYAHHVRAAMPYPLSKSDDK